MDNNRLAVHSLYGMLILLALLLLTSPNGDGTLLEWVIHGSYYSAGR